MKYKKKVTVVAIVFFVAMALLTFFSKTIENLTLPKVIATTVSSGVVHNELKENGLVKATSEWKVCSESVGVVTEIKAIKGEHVKKGQEIFVIEVDRSEEISELEKTVRNLERQYEKTMVGVSVDSAIDKSEKSIDEDKIMNQRAKLDFSKKENEKAQDKVEELNGKKEQLEKELAKLSEKKELADGKEEIEMDNELDIEKEKRKQKEIDDIDKDLKNANKKLKESEKKLKNAEEELLSYGEALDLKNAKDELDDAKKKLEAVKTMDDKYIVYAPADGMIKTINCELGQKLDSPDQVIASLAITEGGWLVEVPLSEKQAGLLEIGDIGQISDIRGVIDDEVKITSISYDEENHPYAVMKTEGNLKLGQEVKTYVDISEEIYDLVIPVEAIYRDDKETYLYVMEEQSAKLQSKFYICKKKIEIIAEDDNYAAIVGEVYEGNKIIIDSNQELSNGARVYCTMQ